MGYKQIILVALAVSILISSPVYAQSLWDWVFGIAPAGKTTAAIGQANLQRGDVNVDSFINSGDIDYLTNYVFKGGPPPNPKELGDVNCDGRIDITDIVYLGNYLYKNGPAPCPLKEKETFCSSDGTVCVNVYIDGTYDCGSVSCETAKSVPGNQTFLCGDANKDSVVRLTDVIYLVNYIFKGGPAPDFYAADVDGSGKIDLTDIIKLVDFLFKGGTLNCFVPKVDLAVTDIIFSPDDKPKLGENRVVTAIVKNNGNIGVNYSFGHAIAPPGLGGSGGAFCCVYIGPNQTKEHNLGTINFSLVGTWGFEASAYPEKYNDTNPIDNRRTEYIIIANLTNQTFVDLSAELEFLPDKKPKFGENRSIRGIVKNLGNVKVNYSYAFSVSPPGNQSGPGLGLCCDTIFPGEKKVHDFGVYQFNQYGLWTFKFTVTTQNDSNLANNEKTEYITISNVTNQTFVDLAVTDIVFSPDPSPNINDIRSVTADIKNLGTKGANYSVSSSYERPDGVIVVSKATAPEYIGPGEIKKIDLGRIVFSQVGTWKITASVVSYDGEINPTDNERTEEVIIIGDVINYCGDNVCSGLLTHKLSEGESDLVLPYKKFTELGGAQHDYIESINLVSSKLENITTIVYRTNVKFTQPVNFSSPNVRGQPIQLFGELDYIGSTSDISQITKQIVLFKGGEELLLTVGEEKAIVTDGSTAHIVKLLGVSDNTTGVISVDGTTIEIVEGFSYIVSGLAVYAKDVLYYGTGRTDHQMELVMGIQNTLTVGDTKEVMINGIGHSVKLFGVSDNTTGVISVDGTTMEIVKGNTYVISGLSVYAKDVLYYGTGRTDHQMELVMGATELFMAGDEKVIKMGGTVHVIKLFGVADPITAVISVDGTTQEINEGNTYTIAGVSVYAKDILYYGVNATNHQALLFFGTKKVTFKDGESVKVGNEDTSIDYTLVSMNLSAGGVSSFSVLDSSWKGIFFSGGSRTDLVWGFVTTIKQEGSKYDLYVRMPDLIENTDTCPQDCGGGGGNGTLIITDYAESISDSKIIEVVKEVENVKPALDPQKRSIVTEAQVEIINTVNSVESYQKSISQRNFLYTLTWWFGGQVVQEQRDAGFFREQAGKLQENREVLEATSEKLKPHANELANKVSELVLKAQEKERRARGLFGSA